MSADEKNRYLAEIREKALKNERSELAAAEKKGIEKGLQQGILQGIREGLSDAIEMGLSLKFGDEGLAIMPLIKNIQDCERLRVIRNTIKTAKNLSELKALIGN